MTTNPHPPTTRRPPLDELSRLDRAVYGAVAGSPTPTLDSALRRLSRTADKSVLWFGVAGLLAVAGGAPGRRAAVNGLVSIGIASAFVNLGVKPFARRRRPDRFGAEVPDKRHVPMPGSTSFPSGHSASAFAFAEGVSSATPAVGIPVRIAAATVAYSRVHTGVHYPGDVIVGSIIGMSAGEAGTRVADLIRSRRAAGSLI